MLFCYIEALLPNLGNICSGLDTFDVPALRVMVALLVETDVGFGEPHVHRGPTVSLDIATRALRQMKILNSEGNYPRPTVDNLVRIGDFDLLDPRDVETHRTEFDAVVRRWRDGIIDVKRFPTTPI